MQHKKLKTTTSISRSAEESKTKESKDSRSPLPFLDEISSKQDLYPVGFYIATCPIFHSYLAIFSTPPKNIKYKYLEKELKKEERKKLTEEQRKKLTHVRSRSASIVTFGGGHNPSKNFIHAMGPHSPFKKMDLDELEQGRVPITFYPTINATCVFELERELREDYQYLLEKRKDLAGKLLREEKDDLNDKTQNAIKQITSRLITYHNRAKIDSLFSGNCNSITYSAAREIAYRSAQESKTEEVKISRNSIFHIGANHPVFIRHSALHRKMLNFYIPPEDKMLSKNKIDLITSERLKELKLKKKDEKISPLLQELANNKKYILDVIFSWPEQQQIHALKQIVNVKMKMPLGVIFSTDAVNKSGKRIKEPNFKKLAEEKLNSLVERRLVSKKRAW